MESENRNSRNQLDMTPMVDVTFLLLIFFMVTASFSVQKSMSQDPLTQDLPSPFTQETEVAPQYVEVRVDRFNTYRLTSRDTEEVEAASDQELQVRLRDMVQATNASQLRISAHGDSWHQKVVTAWDAGIENDIQDVVIRLDDDYLAGNLN